jgi:hypothetical protein
MMESWEDQGSIPWNYRTVRSGLSWRATRLAARRGAVPRIGGQLCINPEVLRKWVRHAEVDEGIAGGLTTSECQRIPELEKELKEVKRANEMADPQIGGRLKMDEDLGCPHAREDLGCSFQALRQFGFELTANVATTSTAADSSVVIGDYRNAWATFQLRAVCFSCGLSKER